MQRNYRMELQYDGTGLHGWAKQDGLQTVEGCLEEAFRTVFGRVPALRVAGRTDSGVHARRQVVSLFLPSGVDLPKLRRSLDALTPPGIAVVALRPAPATFDARKDATSRTYRYFVAAQPVVSPFWTRYCWQVFADIDLGAMQAAAGQVVGRHCFTAFTPTETGHVFFDRTVLRCRWSRAKGAVLPAETLGVGGRPSGGSGGMFCVEIEADSFLRHMVRTLVGTMIEVGEGVRSQVDLGRLLDGAPRDAAGLTAPAHGLFLWDVRYGRPVGKSSGVLFQQGGDSED